MAPIFFIVKLSSFKIQSWSRMAAHDQLAWLEQHDFTIFIHYTVQCLVTELFHNGVLLQELNLNLGLQILCAFPNLLVEYIFSYFQQIALTGDNYGKDLTHQTDPIVQWLVTDDAPRNILGDVLIFQRIFFVVSEQYSAIENDIDKFIRIEYYITMNSLTNS